MRLGGGVHVAGAIRHHGIDAVEQAIARADELEHDGNKAGVAMWREIARAVERLAAAAEQM